MLAKKDTKALGTKRKSHYVYSKWLVGKNGARVAIQVVPARNSPPPPLLSTCIKNPSTGSDTVFAIAWDLDAHRASGKWKDKKGRLDWTKMGAFLEENHPELKAQIFAAVRSTGGKGLAVWLAVSPFELSKKTSGVQAEARRLQDYAIRLFNDYGFGADPGAVGLKRDFCSYKNPPKTVFLEEETLRLAQKEKKNVVTELRRLLEKEQSVVYRKRGDSSLLHKDARVEAKLARLYVDLEETFLEAKDYKVKDLMDVTGASEGFIRRFLVKATTGQVSWLSAQELLGHGEGFALQLLDDHGKYSARAHDLLSPKAKVFTPQLVLEALVNPSEVEDGYRNRWVTNLCLQLKWAGISHEEASKVVSHLVKLIPGCETSRTCNDHKKILCSIYLNHKQMFGIKTTDILPSFVLNVLYASTSEQKTSVDVKKASAQKIESCLLSQKGTTSPVFFSGLVVSVVRCFSGWGVWKCLDSRGVVVNLVGKVERPLVVGDLVEAKGDLFCELNEWEHEVREFKADGLILRVGFDVRKGLEGLPQMGPDLAKRVYSKFGEESFQAIRKGHVLEVPKVGAKRVALWCEYLVENA